MEKIEDIIRLIELIKDSPQEHWEYNKQRLTEVLRDHDEMVINKVKRMSQTINFANLSIRTNEVNNQPQALKKQLC